MNKCTINLIDEDNNIIPLKSNVFIANNFFSRLKGLIGSKELTKEDGLLIYPCNQIHMFFMKYPIDVIYMDKDFNILRITRNIKPWRIDSFVKNSYYVLEVKTLSIPYNFNYKKINIKYH